MYVQDFSLSVRCCILRNFGINIQYNTFVHSFLGQLGTSYRNINTYFTWAILTVLFHSIVMIQNFTRYTLITHISNKFIYFDSNKVVFF